MKSQPGGGGGASAVADNGADPSEHPSEHATYCVPHRYGVYATCDIRNVTDNG